MASVASSKLGALPQRKMAAMRSLAASRLMRSMKKQPTLSDPATRKALRNLATLMLSPREW